MDFQLFSIEQMPRTLPVWELILDDLGRPPVPRIARALGVGAATVYRWQQTGRWPRMACLSLFWLTRWGRSEIDCRAVNDAVNFAGWVRCLREDNAKLQRQVQQLDQERQHLLARLELLVGLSTAPQSVESGHTAAPAPSLHWPALPEPCPLAALPEPTAQAVKHWERQALAGHRGSPEAPPPPDRSTTAPSRARTARPRP